MAAKSLNLSKIDTRAPKSFDKEQTKKETLKMLLELDELQNLLYAENKHSILLIVQGMDASGKDGLVNDVFSHVNPNGVVVHSFKEPTEEELSHDFLWRLHKKAPPKRMIHVFNRSYYEDVLVTRVHDLCDDKLAKKRFEAINDFEQLLTTHNNTTILKLYLHISEEEQLQRLQERMSIPRKMWKYNANDIIEAGAWKQYRKYYDEIFKHCNDIPWHIVPADQNWFKDYKVTKLLHETLSGFDMRYPGLKK